MASSRQHCQFGSPLCHWILTPVALIFVLKFQFDGGVQITNCQQSKLFPISYEHEGFGRAIYAHYYIIRNLFANLCMVEKSTKFKIFLNKDMLIIEKILWWLHWVFTLGSFECVLFALKCRKYSVLLLFILLYGRQISIITYCSIWFPPTGMTGWWAVTLECPYSTDLTIFVTRSDVIKVSI